MWRRTSKTERKTGYFSSGSLTGYFGLNFFHVRFRRPPLFFFFSSSLLVKTSRKIFPSRRTVEHFVVSGGGGRVTRLPTTVVIGRACHWRYGQLRCDSFFRKSKVSHFVCVVRKSIRKWLNLIYNKIGADFTILLLFLIHFGWCSICSFSFSLLQICLWYRRKVTRRKRTRVHVRSTAGEEKTFLL